MMRMSFIAISFLTVYLVFPIAVAIGSQTHHAQKGRNRTTRKKNILRGFSHLLLFSIILFMSGIVIGAASPVEIKVDTTSQSIEKGKEFSINIYIDPVNNPISAAQFNLLFDGSLVNMKNVTEGYLFKKNGINTIFGSGTFNNSDGILINVWGLTITPGANVTTKGTFAIITMSAKGAGSSTLNLTNVIVSNPKSNAIQVNITNGSIIVSTYDTAPPASTTNLRNISYSRNYINWTWTDPVNPDFSRVMVYLNGKFQTNVSKGVRFYNATGLSSNTSYTISTRTVDVSGNINKSWLNHTAKTASEVTAPVSTTFFDNFESGANKWTSSGLWHFTTRRFNSKNHGWWYGQESTRNYNTGAANSGGLISPAIYLKNTSKPMLSFMSWYNTEYSNSYDKKLVQISVDNGPWVNLKQISGARKIWVREQIDLSSYAGKTIKIRLYFDTVDRLHNKYEGWYIDDVRVE